MHASVTSAAIALPATMTIIKSDATEVNNGRVSCTVMASGHSAFTDAAGASPGVGAGDPDEDTLNIVSCSFSLAENVQVSHEVQDKMILGGDGAPGARATCLQKNSFTTRFRGDLPAGVVLGTSGAGVKGLEDGKLLVNQLMEEQKMDDFNGGSVGGNHYPLAA
ncbi:hypothetical protein [Verrucomicrobium spinosum]|nr:hypothetical protein [Verrucomicrobium spinosum]